jgi:CRISPR type III-A-associated protein Csm2
MAEEKFFFRKADKEKLVTTEAEKIANELVGNNPRKPDLKSSQLRKFYMEVKSLERKVEAEGFEKIKPLIKMLKVKVNYQRGRGLVPPKFVEFITKCVDNVNDREDFKDFVMHFEAVVGYYYGKAEKFD